MPLDLALLDRWLAERCAARPDRCATLSAEAEALRVTFDDDPVVRPPLLPIARAAAKLERGVPLLHDEALYLDLDFAAPRFARLGALLADASGQRGNGRAGGERPGFDLGRALAEGLARHEEHLRELARWAGVDGAWLSAVAQRTAAPILQAYAARLAPTVALGSWARGYCPICGAWPALVERPAPAAVGVLRCADCGASWPQDGAACPFCGQRAPARRPPLEVAADVADRTLERCDRCGGYLVGRVAREPTPGPLVRLEALAAAPPGDAERRPAGVGFRIELAAADDEPEEVDW